LVRTLKNRKVWENGSGRDKGLDKKPEVFGRKFDFRVNSSLEESLLKEYGVLKQEAYDKGASAEEVMHIWVDAISDYLKRNKDEINHIKMLEYRLDCVKIFVKSLKQKKDLDSIETTNLNLFCYL
jgi:hypothetical protein